MIKKSLSHGINSRGLNTHGLWSLFIVGGYISLLYVTGVTRYKTIFFALIAATALWHIIRYRKACLSQFKNPISLCIGLFTLVLIYGLLISPDWRGSLSDIKNSHFRDVLLMFVLVVLVLMKTPQEQVLKMVITAFTAGLLFVCLREIYLYYLDYRRGIMPFTNYNHRDVADALIIFFPVLIAHWNLMNKRSVWQWAGLLTLGALMLFVLLGTLARGAWLAVLIMYFLAFGLNRNKGMIVAALLVLALGAVAVSQYGLGKNSGYLNHKLIQTDSSHRYKNGVQDAAYELIMKKPLKGHGIGRQVYNQTYDAATAQHPDWTYRTSIGSHNIFLTYWFACGIAGLLAMIYLVFTFSLSGAIAADRRDKRQFQVIITLVTSFLGYIVVRGNFENVHISVLGVLFALLLMATRIEKRTT